MNQEVIAQNRFLYIVSKAKRIALVCHRKPDCDTVGSMLAFYNAYENSDTEITPFSIDQIPEQMQFMKGIDVVKNLSDFNPAKFNLVIAFDCGDFSQTGFVDLGVKRSMLPVLVNIDHHGNEEFGDINIIDTEVSSTAEMVYQLLIKLGKEVDKEMATSLMSGIIQDTDNFKNPNTNIESFNATSELLSRGVNMKKLNEHLNLGRSVNGLHAWGKILSRAKKHKELNIVTTYITHADIKECKTEPEDIEGIANFLNSMPDVKAACVLIEQEKGEIKGSLRTLSDDVDVSKLAQFFGGGGHRRAAGFIVSGSFEEVDSKMKIQ